MRGAAFTCDRDQGRPVQLLRRASYAEQPLRTFRAMAEEYVAAIRGVQRKGPHYLGGWSAGGVIVFEVAHCLREQGEEVALLAMIDSLYPDRSGGARKPTRTEQRKFERLVLDEPAPLPERYAEGRTLHEIFLEYWLEYSPRPYDGKITMFMADKQLSRMRDALAVVRGEMKRGPFGKARRALRTAERIERMSPLRWRGVAEGGIELISVPGSHAEMIRGQGAAQIAQALGERMP